MGKKYYAHSLEGRPTEEWQPLEVQMKGGKNGSVLQETANW